MGGLARAGSEVSSLALRSDIAFFTRAMNSVWTLIPDTSDFLSVAHFYILFASSFLRLSITSVRSHSFTLIFFLSRCDTICDTTRTVERARRIEGERCAQRSSLPTLGFLLARSGPWIRGWSYHCSQGRAVPFYGLCSVACVLRPSL